MSNFSIKQTSGDSAGPSDTGLTNITNTSNNFVRVNQTVAQNGSVVATAEPATTTYDVTAYGSDIIYTDVLAMEFTATFGTAVGSPPAGYVPQIYIKLKAAHDGTHDCVIQISGNNTTFTWVNPSITTNPPNSTNDANANAMSLTNITLMLEQAIGANITSITVVPDKYYPATITGTIELSV